MPKWERAYYLIEAKECIDSLLFMQDNAHKLSNLDLSQRIQERRRTFYINLVIVFDKTPTANKKQIKDTNPLISQIYYERDKHSAHADDDYCPHEFQWDSSIRLMQQQLEEIYTICKPHLPPVLTIDYVAHDKVLFRALHGITDDVEQAFNAIQYNTQLTPYQSPNSIALRIVYTLEQARQHKGDSSWGVLIKCGLTHEEGLQERQRGCILMNVLMKRPQNIWVTPINENHLALAQHNYIRMQLLQQIKKEIINGKT